MSSLTDYLSKTIREQHQKIKQLEEKLEQIEFDKVCSYVYQK